MKKILKFPLYILVAVSLILLLVLISEQRKSQQPWENFRAPDDILTARHELAHKFVGPQYFHFVQPKEVSLSYPYIQTSDASAQIEGIVKALSLPPDATSKIEKVISRLAIRPSSRLVGVDRVNFLQLNLALDEMR